MDDTSKKGDGVAVDIRAVLLTIVVSMAAAFWCGVAFVPPQGAIDSVFSVANPIRRRLAIGSASSVEHSPSGQHLQVDIKGINAAFLDSEERLAAAMVQTVEEAGLTMLSYHCHKLMPAGISCVGVLLESHISFHTWPEDGVITLDLFTPGSSPLLPVVPVIQRLFGIGENTETKWGHELRGFRFIGEKKKHYLDKFSELSFWILSPLEVTTKNMIYSNLTKYQRVDIWDLTEPHDTPSYSDAIKHNLGDGDPRYFDSAYYTPDRILFLDGIMQSFASTDSDYHEALVHPAMFAHPSPVNVAIIGGGEGATLREVLKHSTVDHVTMIEIDEEFIQIAREHLAQMSDCSNLVGRAENCFDDEIVEIFHESGLKWFIDRYSPDATKKARHGLFDAIIVDDVPFSSDLYVDAAFVSSIMNSLSDNGVIMIHIGTAPYLLEPKADVGNFKIREKLLNLFEEHPEVAAMHVYEGAPHGYTEPHAFLVVCKDLSCRSRWYARSDAVDFEIFRRTVKTVSGEGALHYFDGVTQQSYQSPPISWETLYCRREPTPFECAYRHLDFTRDIFELDLVDNEDSAFKVDLTATDAGVVRLSSVFATVDIPQGSYIMSEHLAKSLALSKDNIEDIKRSADEGATGFQELVDFVEKHAHTALIEDAGALYLEVGASTLIRVVSDESAANIGRWVPVHPAGQRPAYSPVYDRHRLSFEVFLVATQDIPAGAELTRCTDALGKA